MTQPIRQPRIITLVLMAGLSALSMNIFLPSLAGMAAEFGVDYRVMQLSVSAYLGVGAVLQLLIGPISDRFGRRPVTMAAIALFLLATLGTLVAPNATVFLICRMAQAIVVTAIVLSRAVVRDLVEGPRAASMIGYVTMGMSVVPMIGPLIGGALDQAFGWRASFAFLGLCGLAVLALVWADLSETARPAPDGFAAQRRAWPRLLASHRFWGYCAAATTSSGAFFAYLGGAAFIGSEVYHLTPAQLGGWFAAPALGYAAGNFLAGRLSVRLGIDRMIRLGAGVGVLALGIALALMLAGLHHPVIFFGAVGALGISNGLVLPNANAGMMSVRPELAASASGLGGALNIGGGAALSALAGAALTPATGAEVLLGVMLASCSATLLALAWVAARNRRAQDDD
ncbi:multidrug effflux MFS transporter [Paracoccus sp. p4-l81]|uniref:multidrug effflux MFS transporter n=1 Tax=Paracoccus sp. p4-l81 TaxID=3342806 RepID=UPI0035B84593